MQRVSVVGLGKLGAPMAAVYAKKGFQVFGVDKNQSFVEHINNAQAPVDEPQLQDLISAHKDKLQAFTDYEQAIAETDLTFIIVPTPSQKDGTFSNDYVLSCIEEMGPHLKKKDKYHLVVITSTVMPGATEGVIKPYLEKCSGKKVGADLGLCYSPEFIALGTVVRDMLNPDMFLIGESDKKAGDILESVYRKACDNHPQMKRMNFVNAELTKISVNAFVTTKISYANMLSHMCDFLPESDVDVVTDAVGQDARIGQKYLRGAVAYGGPCFPRDNVAFSSLASTIGADTSLAKATDTINRLQDSRVLSIIETRKPHTRNVGILGLSYKPGTPVIEESQGIKLGMLLKSKGYKVTVFDPESLENSKKILGDSVSYAASAEDCIAHTDMVVIMTAWPQFKNLDVSQKNKDFLVIDCWRVLDRKEANIVYLGKGALAKTISVTADIFGLEK